MKRILSVFLCLGMLGTANVYAVSGIDGTMGTGAFGGVVSEGVTGEAGVEKPTEEPKDDESNIDSGVVNETINWSYNKETGKLVISGKGAMPDYANDSDTPWSKYIYMDIKEIVIEDGITHVGNYMCYYSDSLEKLTIAGSVKSIGKDAFGYCVNLSEVNLNE